MKILYVTPRCPYSMASGGEVRSGYLLNALNHLGEVEVVQIDPYGSDTKAQMQSVGKRQKILLSIKEKINPFKRYIPSQEASVALAPHLRHPLGEYSHLVSRYLWGAFQIEVPKSVKKIADLDDCTYRTDPPDLGSWLRSWPVSRLKRAVLHHIEKSRARDLDAAFVLAERDRYFVDGIPVQLLENIVPSRAEPLRNCIEVHHDSGRLLFVGTLTYAPNFEGLTWFLRNCWPGIIRTRPKTTITVVGHADTACSNYLRSVPGVVYLGFVDDLSPHYEHCDVVIAPIFSGGGALVKIPEAVSFHRPVVASDFSAEGYSASLTPGTDIVSCADAADFVRSIDCLLSDVSKRSRQASHAHAVLQSRFSETTFNQRVADLLRST